MGQLRGRSPPAVEPAPGRSAPPARSSSLPGAGQRYLGPHLCCQAAGSLKAPASLPYVTPLATDKWMELHASISGDITGNTGNTSLLPSRRGD